MTGNHYRDGVAPQGLPDRAHRFGIADFAGDIEVGSDAPPRDLPGGLQNLLLEIGQNADVGVEVESGALSIEIGFYLPVRFSGCIVG